MMKDDTNKTDDIAKCNALKLCDILYTQLTQITPKESVVFTPAEVEEILAKENNGAKANYDAAIAKFMEANDKSVPPKVKRFVVYWGYPGAGKSVMTQKVITRFANEEDCLPFNIIDKDNHRDLFPNLFDHLKGEHIEECEKFAGVTIDYVRKILDLSLQAGQRSVLSIGSMGAGSEFRDNAIKALQYGYKPCAVYMSVNKDIAYLSNIYRSAVLYDQIIFHNKQLYPRLVSSEYFGRVTQMLPKMIDNINHFQKENSQDIDLLVLNRHNELLYDSRRPHLDNVRDIIEREETRPLRNEELILITKQLYQIEQNMLYRARTNIYAPTENEVEAAKTAVKNIAELIENSSNNKAANNNFNYALISGITR